MVGSSEPPYPGVDMLSAFAAKQGLLVHLLAFCISLFIPRDYMVDPIP